MERLVKDEILPNLDFSYLSTCVECVKGKLISKVRKDKIARCGDVLELIHIDICGPFTPTTFGGYRYFITFTNDFSHYGHVELIYKKSDSLVAFKEFKVKMELQKNKKLKSIRSDISSEFYGRYDKNGWSSRPFSIYLHECSIDAQSTMHDTLQQNDIAKRRNHTWLAIVRSMLANSSLPNYLWGEALRMTTYILNLVPSKYVSKTPFEFWLGRKPNLHHFRV